MAVWEAAIIAIKSGLSGLNDGNFPHVRAHCLHHILKQTKLHHFQSHFHCEQGSQCGCQNMFDFINFCGHWPFLIVVGHHGLLKLTNGDRRVEWGPHMFLLSSAVDIFCNTLSSSTCSCMIGCCATWNSAA